MNLDVGHLWILQPVSAKLTSRSCRVSYNLPLYCRFGKIRSLVLFFIYVFLPGAILSEQPSRDISARELAHQSSSARINLQRNACKISEYQHLKHLSSLRIPLQTPFRRLRLEGCCEHYTRFETAFPAMIANLASLLDIDLFRVFVNLLRFSTRQYLRCYPSLKLETRIGSRTCSRNIA